MMKLTQFHFPRYGTEGGVISEVCYQLLSSLREGERANALHCFVGSR